MNFLLTYFGMTVLLLFYYRNQNNTRTIDEIRQDKCFNSLRSSLAIPEECERDIRKLEKLIEENLKQEIKEYECNDYDKFGKCIVYE